MSTDRVREKIRQSAYYAAQLENLTSKKKTVFSGMLGASSAAVLSALKDRFPSMLIITSSTEKAETLQAELDVFGAKGVRIFSSPDALPGEGIPLSRDVAGQRLAVIDSWVQGQKSVVIAPIKALMAKTSADVKNLCLSEKQKIARDALIEQLTIFGYRRFPIVGEKGEFAVRGGIIDIFPLQGENPIRIELADDSIESLRSFDAYSQRSRESLKQALILPAEEHSLVPVFNYLTADTLVVSMEPLDIKRVAEQQKDELLAFAQPEEYLTLEAILALAERFPQAEFSCLLMAEQEPLFNSPPIFSGQLESIPPQALIISRHALRLREELGREVLEGSLSGGFVFDDFLVLSDKELFHAQQTWRKKAPLVKEGVADELLADLKIHDYVVHENYGIGRYQGMHTLVLDGVKEEYMLLEFAGGDKVYVPPALSGMVEKYSGGGESHPRLSRLGTQKWLRTKSKVKKALRDMTQELLALYAARQKTPGYAFLGDNLWQEELAATFPYTETADQLKAIKAVLQDMEKERPMDRLVCGDVGYGKTEVAMRAAAKAVSAGKQVAILVPTTILAEQHYNNFKERFSASPFIIEMLSRFRLKEEQKEVAKRLASHGIDIVIGTHRLLQKDIKFHDLGLLIIDEEQRFGVAHKEKLKQMKTNVDVLTLTATPIPRTFYLSLSGSRDLSLIHTPPVDRSPIRTYVVSWNEALVREAILRELDRGGQVYYVHNFVESIVGMAAKIKKLLPEARVTIGHGQMPGKELEKTMLDFMERKFDVLVCTSIIESGLDITNVNTILVDHADRFGLSQLYQIRGRVGRSDTRAYAYLFYHPDKIMTDQSVERLKAIQEFTALGSGYKLAMRDLEIRGAGNLLGAEQSGHILEVGFDLYCELLDEAVQEIKGEKIPLPREVSVDLKIEAFIPPEYVSDDRQRIALYRRLNLLRSLAEIEEMKKEIRERFGKFPAPLDRLFAVLHLKIRAMQAGVINIREEKSKISMEWLSGKHKRIEIKSGDKIKQIEPYIAG